MKRKGSREEHVKNLFRKDRLPKKKPPLNPSKAEKDDSFVSTSAKKMELDEDFDVRFTNNIDYQILNFVTVFTAISNCIRCKQCDGNIEFKISSIRGLGFKINILCSKDCQPTVIPSCPVVGTAYEINTRICFVFRVLGIELNGLKKFCGLMDLPTPPSQAVFDAIVSKIVTASTVVRNIVLRKAVKEEQECMLKEVPDFDVKKLTVSGNGSWQTWGFKLLFGILFIIGFYSGKVLNVACKSVSYEMCDYWKPKSTTAKEEVEAWQKEHAESCTINHSESSRKIEIDAIKEMFIRSEELFGVQYASYIGDGDSQTYSEVVASKPYKDVEIIKKECIKHVQKCMGSRLRALIKNEKDLKEKSKLTEQIIDEITLYYGLAIQRHKNSIKDMYNEIWASFYHYSSSNEKPQHNLCPAGADSWCNWQCAKVNGQLQDFQHDYNPLPENVLNKLKPIYTDLSKESLLQRCLGGFTQNSNENFYNLVWIMTANSSNCSKAIVDIALNCATCVFNTGTTSLLKIMETMGVNVGQRAHLYAQQEDDCRISKAKRDVYNAMREATICRKHQNENIIDQQLVEEGSLHDSGINDLS